ncbi:class I SAM-dependent methyltransferase [Amycolatopsis sp. NBC_00345]|uniref:class I SAM-dependent methyltransferase n=1 Tax=Amycolatopsis sp. NBC_00345 TaxID=2975955 RepID=UPI002E26D51E
MADTSPSTVRGLIAAADTDDDAITSTVRGIGAEHAADLLIDELVSRADFGELLDYPPITARFDLRFDGGLVRHELTIAKGDVLHRIDGDAEPQAVVTQDLTDLVRAVFGPSVRRNSPTRVITWNHLEEPGSLFQQPWVFTTVRRLLRGAEDITHDLPELSLRFGSDKWGLHYYLPRYDEHFSRFREIPATVVEIGVGGYDDPQSGGGSLRTWKRYFHRGMIYGVDIVEKESLAQQRIKVLKGDQSDPAFLAELVAETGPLDIVIDDGSHCSSDIITSFKHLFPHVRMGGLYVIEDMQTSYWPSFGGTSDALTDPGTSVGFTKELIDGLNHEELIPPEARAAQDTDRSIFALHFYHNLLVIEKKMNAEGTLPSWIPRKRPN